MKWPEDIVRTIHGQQKAIAPLIISASRSTDIPAFYSDWFINRLRAGHVKWINPFNRKSHYISFKNAKVIVFWSKNPYPLLKYLPEIDKRGIAYYFQFTVNDYKKEGFEPNVPSLEKRIETFQKLSSMIGKEKVIWRFDPLLLTDSLNTGDLISKIDKVGESLHTYTEKLVISFADISTYSKVQRNLKAACINYREFQSEDMEIMAGSIDSLNKKWGLKIATCGEKIDLDRFNIQHNKCIDDELIIRIAEHDKHLMSFLGYKLQEQRSMFSKHNATKSLKDKGQRKECGCIVSKDIGQYNTCPHLCLYCYANYSPKTVQQNRQRISANSESILAI